MKKTYYVEVTDLYCGELNYSWIHRYHVKASSKLGAIRKISRLYGLNFRSYSDYDCSSGIYHSTSKLTGVYIDELDTDLSINYHYREL